MRHLVGFDFKNFTNYRKKEELLISRLIANCGQLPTLKLFESFHHHYLKLIQRHWFHITVEQYLP
jgi:hypothetical protein